MSSRTALILTLAALSLSAQGRLRPERPPLDRPMGRPGPGGGPLRERVMAQLHELRMKKIQQSLGVPEEKARAIADRWAQFDQESISRRRLMNELRQQNKNTLMGPGSEEDKNKKLQPIVEHLAGLRQQQEESRKRFEEDLRGSLTPAQQGRFILLVEEFQQTLKEAIQERRRERER